MNENQEQQIKLGIKFGLATGFLICLGDMPYGYYEFIRWAAAIGFSIMANFAHKENNSTEMILWMGLVMLFQPLVKIPLGRTIWNIVDVLVAIRLLMSAYKQKKAEQEN